MTEIEEIRSRARRKRESQLAPDGAVSGFSQAELDLEYVLANYDAALDERESYKDRVTSLQDSQLNMTRDRDKWREEATDTSRALDEALTRNSALRTRNDNLRSDVEKYRRELHTLRQLLDKTQQELAKAEAPRPLVPHDIVNLHRRLEQVEEFVGQLKAAVESSDAL